MDRYSDLEQLAFVYDEANLFLITADSNHFVSKISVFAADVLGQTVEECLGKKLTTLFFSKANTSKERSFNESLQKNANFELDLSLNGSPFNLIVKPLFNLSEVLEGFSILGIDLSATYSQQEDQLQGYQLNKDLLTQSAIALCFTDMEGHFVEVNDAYCDLFEVSRDQVIGQEFIAVHCAHLSPDEKEQIREASASTLNKGQRQHTTDILLQSSKGRPIHVEITRKIIRVNGYPLVAASLLDVTAKKDILKQFTEQNIRLRELAFVSSNKMRQPLTNIIGLIEIVKGEAHNANNVMISADTLMLLTSQLDKLAGEMGQVIAEIDHEVEKNLFLIEQPTKSVRTIWLVDDDQVIAYITQRLINNADPSIQVSTFLSAKMALEKLRFNSEGPDILLLDINMPGINGWQFLDELRVMQRFVNVYMYSSSIDPEDIKKARSYPMVRDFLAKPIEASSIRSLLDIPVIRTKAS
jgi:PAS domain S-box-containing protein